MILLLLPVLLGLGAALAISEGVQETALVTLINVLAWLMGVIFYPINLLLETAMPQFSGLADTIQPIFDQLSTPIAWLINSVFITAPALTLVIGYYTFKYSVSILMWSVKVLFKWKNAVL